MYKKLWWLLVAVFVVIVCLNIKGVLKIFYPLNYSGEIEKYATEYKLDRHMVYALIRVESKFIPDARSGRSAIGLMQITPDTGKYIARLLGEQGYEEKLLYDPATNIRYGCYYLHKLLEDFDNDTNCALAAYNGGEGNVRKWAPLDENGKRTLDVQSIPFAETRKYVGKVNKYQRLYKYLYTEQMLIDFLLQ